MRTYPKPTPTTWLCKIKAVNPPVRSVSTPRHDKHFREFDWVNRQLCHRPRVASVAAADLRLPSI